VETFHDIIKDDETPLQLSAAVQEQSTLRMRDVTQPPQWECPFGQG